MWCWLESFATHTHTHTHQVSNRNLKLLCNVAGEIYRLCLHSAELVHSLSRTQGIPAGRRRSQQDPGDPSRIPGSLWLPVPTLFGDIRTPLSFCKENGMKTPSFILWIGSCFGFSGNKLASGHSWASVNTQRSSSGIAIIAAPGDWLETNLAAFLL